MSKFFTKVHATDVDSVEEFCRDEKGINFIGNMYEKGIGKAYRKALWPIVEVDNIYYLAYLTHSGIYTHIDFHEIDEFNPEDFLTEDEVEIKLILRTKQEVILYGFLNENLHDAKMLVTMWLNEGKNVDIYTVNGEVKAEEFCKK